MKKWKLDHVHTIDQESSVLPETLRRNLYLIVESLWASQGQHNTSHVSSVEEGCAYHRNGIVCI